MALIEFNDLPNTTTPINATNLNNNFNELNNKSSLSARSGTDGTATSVSGTDAISTTGTILKIGTKFTLSSGIIVVGSGVSKVRISGVAIGNFVNNSTDTAYDVGARFVHNGTGIHPTALKSLGAGTTEEIVIGLTPIILEVNENDTLSLGIYSASGHVTKQAKRGSYIFVEEV